MQIHKKLTKPKARPAPVYDIHVKLDPDSFSRVLELARKEDRAISSMARRIITLWLNGEKHA